jgi:hypothetical protein
MFLLEWLGLAFLLEHVAGNLGDIASLVGPNLKLAWEAADKTSPQRGILIDSAAHGLAQAIAKLFRLILEAIVMFLLAKGAAKLGELTGKLKASKLGKGFGEWVERNWQKLVDDPRYNPKLRPKPRPQAPDGSAPKPETAVKPEVAEQPKTQEPKSEIESEETAKLEKRKQDLAKDPQTGKPNPKSRSEAESILQAEREGVTTVTGEQVKNARRPDLSKGEPNLDFVVDGGYVDVKTPVNPDYRPLSTQASEIAAKANNYPPDVTTVVDLRNLSGTQKADFMQALDAAGADNSKIRILNR